MKEIKDLGSIWFFRVTRNCYRCADDVHFTFGWDKRIVSEWKRCTWWLIKQIIDNDPIQLTTTWFEDIRNAYNISGGNVGLINHPAYIIKILLVRTSGDLVRLGLKGAFVNDIAYAAELVTNQNSRECCWSILPCSWSGWFLHVYMLTWWSANLFCELCFNHHVENWNKTMCT